MPGCVHFDPTGDYELMQERQTKNHKPQIKTDFIKYNKTYPFTLKIVAMSLTSHLIVCMVYCVFAILHIACLNIILLLSVSCPVTVILLHCGASVTITNSVYV